MDDPIRIIENGIDAIQKFLKSDGSDRINSNKTKNILREFVKSYFVIARPLLKSGDLSKLDEKMQDLLRATQHNTRKTACSKMLNQIKKIVNELEIVQATATTSAPFEKRDSRILETLKKICPPAAVSYEQGILDLASGARGSWRGTTTEFREALRELLDKLAPDAEVSQQPGFRFEKDQSGNQRKQPTMKQKVAFILKARNIPTKHINSTQDITYVVDMATSTFTRGVYDYSSMGAHAHIPLKEVRKIKQYVQLALMELLEIED